MAPEMSNTASTKANTNGVLHVTAAQTAGKTPPKVSNPKLKVIVRRLAPGLTEAEFTQIMGEEWTVGRGMVDWFSYKPGKDSKEYVLEPPSYYYDHPLRLLSNYYKTFEGCWMSTSYCNGY